MNHNWPGGWKEKNGKNILKKKRDNDKKKLFQLKANLKKKNEKIFQEQKEPKGMPQTEWQKKQTITQNRGRKRQNLCKK